MLSFIDSIPFSSFVSHSLVHELLHVTMSTRIHNSALYPIRHDGYLLKVDVIAIACTLTFKVLFKGAISTIRHGGYLLKGYVMAIACTLSFTVQFLAHVQRENICSCLCFCIAFFVSRIICIWMPLFLLVRITCSMDMASVVFFFPFTNSAVPKWLFRDIIITKVILLVNITSLACFRIFLACTVVCLICLWLNVLG